MRFVCMALGRAASEQRRKTRRLGVRTFPFVTSDSLIARSHCDGRTSPESRVADPLLLLVQAAARSRPALTACSTR
jgi:hypothetical protein